MTDKPIKLLAIVAVDPERRVRCQQLHCGHSVYARIHVVEEAGQLLVLGSDCFAKRYGNGHEPVYRGSSGGAGRDLTDAEREMLSNNTKALIAQFEAERQLALELAEQARIKEQELAAAAEARLRELREQWASSKKLAELHRAFVPLAMPPRAAAVDAPAEMVVLPEWAALKKQHTSFFAYGAGDGQCWVLMQSATHPGCFIAPAPTLFESWDEALPPTVGRVDLDRGVYASDINISVLSGWFVKRCKNGSRIDSDPMAIQRFALGLQGGTN